MALLPLVLVDNSVLSDTLPAELIREGLSSTRKKNN